MEEKLSLVSTYTEKIDTMQPEDKRETDRLSDMQERYGELCNQQKVSKILGVSSRTILRMLEDGRLRRVETKVDVRSIYNYIENPKQSAFAARYEKKHGHKVKKQIDFCASSISRSV